MPASTLSGRSVALLRGNLDDCTSEGRLISHGNCTRIIYLHTEFLPLASNHYCANGASDNKAHCGGRCNTGWRDDDNNRVDPDSNSRWNNSRWNTLALRKW